jgi:hypothetical protein
MQKNFYRRKIVQVRFICTSVERSSECHDAASRDRKAKEKNSLRIYFTLALGFASLAALVGALPALADCRSENVSCVKGANSPFDSIACGSLYRSCTAHKAIAAQQHGKQMQQNNRPAGAPSSGTHSGRR